MVKSFYASVSPILSKFQLPLLSEVPLSHMGVKGNKKKVDLAIIQLREDYNAHTDLRYMAIENTIATLEFKYIKTKDTLKILEGIQEDIAKLRLLRSVNLDMLQFLIILHEAEISEELAKKFYNPEAVRDPKKWKRYYELHFVPKLSPMDYFV